MKKSQKIDTITQILSCSKLIGRRVIVYVKDNKQVNRRSDLEINYREFVFVKINATKLYTLLFTCQDMCDDLKTSFEMASNDPCSDSIIVNRDFNDNQ